MFTKKAINCPEISVKLTEILCLYYLRKVQYSVSKNVCYFTEYGGQNTIRENVTRATKFDNCIFQTQHSMLWSKYIYVFCKKESSTQYK